MAFSVFVEKNSVPAEGALSGALGPVSHGLWRALKSALAEQHAPVTEEWVFAGRNYGWSLRLKRKSRAIVYLTPCATYFRASFAFGDKAVRAAHESRLPASLLKEIDASRKYAEGRAVRVEVRRPSHVKTVLKLAEIKMNN